MKKYIKLFVWSIIASFLNVILCKLLNIENNTLNYYAGMIYGLIWGIISCKILEEN